MHEKGYDAPDPDNPAYRVIDPDEFFDYYEATGWVRAGGVPIVRWKNVVNTWRRKPAPRSARKSGPSGAKRAIKRRRARGRRQRFQRVQRRLAQTEGEPR